MGGHVFRALKASCDTAEPVVLAAGAVDLGALHEAGRKKEAPSGGGVGVGFVGDQSIAGAGGLPDVGSAAG